MKILITGSNGMTCVVPARGGGVRDWQRWAPYVAVAWSLIYAALGVYWAVSGRGLAQGNLASFISPYIDEPVKIFKNRPYIAE